MARDSANDRCMDADLDTGLSTAGLLSSIAQCLINLAKRSLRISAISHVLAKLLADGCTDLAQGWDLEVRFGCTITSCLLGRLCSNIIFRKPVLNLNLQGAPCAYVRKVGVVKG